MTDTRLDKIASLRAIAECNQLPDDFPQVFFWIKFPEELREASLTVVRPKVLSQNLPTFDNDFVDGSSEIALLGILNEGEVLHFDKGICDEYIKNAKSMTVDSMSGKVTFVADPIEVPFVIEAFLDVNIVSYLARFYDAQAVSDPDQVKAIESHAVNILSELQKSRINWNVSFYLSENADKIRTGDEHTLKELEFIEVLKDLDLDALTKNSVIRPSDNFDQSRAKKNVRDIISSVSTKIHKQEEHPLFEIAYSFLLLTVVIKFSDNKSVKNKIISLLERCESEFGFLSPRLVAISMKYFEKDGLKFFSKLQKGMKNDPLIMIKNMAWDYCKCYECDYHAGRRDENGYVILPYILTADSRFIELLKIYRNSKVWRVGDMYLPQSPDSFVNELTNLIGEQQVERFFGLGRAEKRMTGDVKVEIRQLEEAVTAVLLK